MLLHFLETKKNNKQTNKQQNQISGLKAGKIWRKTNPPLCASVIMACFTGEASLKAQKPQRLVWNNAGHPYCLRGWFRKSGEIIPKSFFPPFLPCPHGWKWKIGCISNMIVSFHLRWFSTSMKFVYVVYLSCENGETSCRWYTTCWCHTSSRLGLEAQKGRTKKFASSVSLCFPALSNSYNYMSLYGLYVMFVWLFMYVLVLTIVMILLEIMLCASSTSGFQGVWTGNFQMMLSCDCSKMVSDHLMKFHFGPNLHWNLKLEAT